MTFFHAEDSEDQVCRWDECRDTKCTHKGVHYHSTKITVCIPQKDTLDVWLGKQDKADKDAGNTAKLSADDVKSLKVTYKNKGLGKVPRVYTNWRRDPYKK